MLSEVAQWCAENDVRFDAYGTGAVLQDLEARVADLLGFDAARFMPSGSMAQPIALRIWSDRAGLGHVGMHPTSHLELHEHRSYAHLHDLRATLVGPTQSPLLAGHFQDLAERLSVLLVELPIREAGGQLPSWDELEALKEAVGATDTKLHLDGARLWECAPFYQRSLAEICAGFDSVYVSFYKGIGALPGAMLLGSRSFIDEAILWQRRSGGNLYTLVPNAASAAMRLDSQLEKMPRYRARALEIAQTLDELDGVRILPDPPHINMMHVFVSRDVEHLHAARDRFAESHGVWLFGGTRPTDVPGTSRFELYIADGALEVTDDEIREGFAALLKLGQG